MGNPVESETTPHGGEMVVTGLRSFAENEVDIFQIFHFRVADYIVRVETISIEGKVCGLIS